MLISYPRLRVEFARFDFAMASKNSTVQSLGISQGAVGLKAFMGSLITRVVGGLMLSCLVFSDAWCVNLCDVFVPVSVETFQVGVNIACRLHPV